MARQRKIFIRNKTYFITFRCEAGLPLPPTLLVNRILESILCKAKSMYEIDIVAFMFMTNHVHLIITVKDPELVDNFILYLKRESAHAVNRLLGRRKRTVWCAGYDSPIILDLDKLINQLAYLYNNAVAGNLVDAVDDYPGLCSWHMFLSETYQVNRSRIRRNSIIRIGERIISTRQQLDIIEQIEKDAEEVNSFILSPYAFMRSFQDSTSEESIKIRIIERVRNIEIELREKRLVKVIGKEKLSTQAINSNYTPKKFGKRMLCLSTVKELRASFIAWYRRLAGEAAVAYQEYKKHRGTLIMPPGMFIPGGLLSSNVWLYE